MDDLVRMSPDPEEFERLKHQVRMTNTALLKGVLDALEPWVDGTMGAIQPGHVTAYVKAIRELGLLWQVYQGPKQLEAAGEGSDEDRMVLEARQGQVLDELAKLREIRGRRGSAS